jgi:hypothetical protein
MISELLTLVESSGEMKQPMRLLAAGAGGLLVGLRERSGCEHTGSFSSYASSDGLSSFSTWLSSLRLGKDEVGDEGGRESSQ